MATSHGSLHGLQHIPEHPVSHRSTHGAGVRRRVSQRSRRIRVQQTRRSWNWERQSAHDTNRGARNVPYVRCARPRRWVIPLAFRHRGAPLLASAFIITRCSCEESQGIQSWVKYCSYVVGKRGSGRGCGNPRHVNRARFSYLPKWPGEFRQESPGSIGSLVSNIGRPIEMSSSMSTSPLTANPTTVSRLDGSLSINSRRSGCRTPT